MQMEEHATTLMKSPASVHLATQGITVKRVRENVLSYIVNSNRYHIFYVQMFPPAGKILPRMPRASII